MRDQEGLQHSLGHVDCAACERLKEQMVSGRAFADLSFVEAAGEWIAGRRRISASSLRLYEKYIAELTRFFGALALRDIHLGNVVAYQRKRQEEIRGSKRHCARLEADQAPQVSDGASRINHEIGCLGQILARAGLWVEIKRFYEPLPLPQTDAMVLSPEEEAHLFQVARSRPRWFVAYCCALISRNTTAGPGEIRHLRLRDIELDGAEGSFIHIVEGVKNKFRERPVPLNGDARWSVLQLLDRAREIGATAPHHYLLPHRAKALGMPADLERPMGSWKKAHYAMCAEASKKFPRLARLRLYDYRHTAATDLLENPSVSFTAIEHMMGHRLNSNTKRKYDHLRNSALRSAAEALDRRHHAVTSMPSPAAPPPGPPKLAPRPAAGSWSARGMRKRPRGMRA